MKKFISLILSLLFIFAIGSACTVSQATRMRDMVGTYKLTYYNNETTNLVEAREMEVYLVVPQTGYGYYVYKDKYTPTYIREVSINIKPHEEKANRYSHISYKFDDTTEYQEYGRSGDGLNKRVLGGQIGSTYWKDTSYKRVDDAQDLSYVKSQMGELPAVIPYGKGVYDGFYKFSYLDYSQWDREYVEANYEKPFVYAIFDMNFATNKATVYYMLTADMQAKEEVYDLSVTTEQMPYTVTVGSKTFEIESNVFSTYSYAYLYMPFELVKEDESKVECKLVFTRATRSSFDLQANIQSDLDWYNSQQGTENN